MSPVCGQRVVGYARVSTEDQHASAEAQQDRIRQYCQLYGLILDRLEIDHGISGATADRPALRRALAALAEGGVSGLVVAKLDRLTRNVRDLGTLLEASEAEGWALLSVADQIDTRSAAGRLVLNVLVSVAQWEREAISERTIAALEVKRRQGVRLGRPPSPLPTETLARLRAWRAEGLSCEAIAAAANEAGIPSARGGRWHQTTVRRALGEDRRAEGVKGRRGKPLGGSRDDAPLARWAIAVAPAA